MFLCVSLKISDLGVYKIMFKEIVNVDVREVKRRSSLEMNVVEMKGATAGKVWMVMAAGM